MQFDLISDVRFVKGAVWVLTAWSAALTLWMLSRTLRKK
jgi:hypothetical protein